jgi:hypothetical protein
MVSYQKSSVRKIVRLGIFDAWNFDFVCLAKFSLHLHRCSITKDCVLQATSCPKSIISSLVVFWGNFKLCTSNIMPKKYYFQSCCFLGQFQIVSIIEFILHGFRPKFKVKNV